MGNETQETRSRAKRADLGEPEPQVEVAPLTNYPSSTDSANVHYVPQKSRRDSKIHARSFFNIEKPKIFLIRRFSFPMTIGFQKRS